MWPRLWATPQPDPRRAGRPWGREHHLLSWNSHEGVVLKWLGESRFQAASALPQESGYTERGLYSL